MSYVALALALAGPAGAWAMQSQPLIALGAFIVAECAAILVALKSFDYAKQFPNHAVMEGAQYVRFAELMRPSASDPSIVTIEQTPVANTSPPKAITSRDETDG